MSYYYFYEWVNRSNRARIIRCFPRTLGRTYYATVADEELLRQEFDNVSSYYKFPAQIESENVESSFINIGSSSGESLNDKTQNQNQQQRQRQKRILEKLKCVMDQRMQRADALPRSGLSSPFSEREILECLGITDTSCDAYASSTVPSTTATSPSSSSTMRCNRKRMKVFTRATMPTFAMMEAIQDMPFYYGNCLTLLPLNSCSQGESEMIETTRRKDKDGHEHGHGHETISVCLLYSKGQSLAVSPIDFASVFHKDKHPSSRSVLVQEHDEMNQHGKNNHPIHNSNNVTQVDVGARIMQVQGCFDAHCIDGTIPEKTLTIVRTSKDCVVVECDTMRNTGCARSCHLKKIATQSYHDSDGNGMEPIHVATRQQNSTTMYGGSMLPTFATLCKSTTDLVMGEYGPCTIYHTTCNGNDLQSQRYEIANLASISQIHFSHMHPMVLWSAARSKRHHELYLGKGYYRRPAIGFGHSLHSIDLRSGKASFVWSQSEDEYMPENTHSISGILVDECNPFSLYISSYSSGKLYHVDARMPARTLCSWYLPGICSEERMYNSPSGIYGSGTLLTKPFLGSCLKNSNDVPILGASKEPNAFGFHLYQKPSNLAHFQTKNLEKVAGHGLDPMGTLAKSSFFPLPVVSENVFTTGIVAFYQPLSCLIDNVNSLDYDFEPEFALCVIYANSLGNLYSYTLAACPQDREGKARPVVGGPIGSCAVPLPIVAKEEQSIQDNPTDKLYWTLRNSYPNQVDAKHEPYELPPTQYKILDPIRTSQMSSRVPKRRLSELNHPTPRISIGPLNKSPPQRRSLIAYFPKQEKSSGNIRRSRSYPVQKPSEDLQNIVSKLRAKQNPRVERSA